AVHVIQAPGVRLLLANLVRQVLGVLVVPGIVVQLGRIVAEEVGSGRAGPARIFPLGLGREAVGFAGLDREPAAILHGRMVGHAEHRLTFAAVAVGLIDVGRRRPADGVRFLLA